MMSQTRANLSARIAAQEPFRENENYGIQLLRRSNEEFGLYLSQGITQKENFGKLYDRN